MLSLDLPQFTLSIASLVWKLFAVYLKPHNLSPPRLLLSKLLSRVNHAPNACEH